MISIEMQTSKEGGQRLAVQAVVVHVRVCGSTTV